MSFAKIDPARRPATYADLLSVPENQIAEIIFGELVTQPRPAAPHARAASRLSVEVGGPFDSGRGGPGGWVILFEPELHLGADVLVPDLAGWRRERMPELPTSAAFTLAPDWVCEVVSPATQTRDRVAKMRIYSREQVKHAWLVDPVAQVLEVFRREGDIWARVQSASGAEVLRAEPFDAIELELARLWER
jgi:Uma2 family endonuclease